MLPFQWCERTYIHGCREGEHVLNHQRVHVHKTDLEEVEGFRTLNIVDRFTRECLAIDVGTSLPGQRRADVGAPA
jgi:hypothetical protein